MHSRCTVIPQILDIALFHRIIFRRFIMTFNLVYLVQKSKISLQNWLDQLISIFIYVGYLNRYWYWQVFNHGFVTVCLTFDVVNVAQHLMWLRWPNIWVFTVVMTEVRSVNVLIAYVPNLSEICGNSSSYALRQTWNGPWTWNGVSSPSSCPWTLNGPSSCSLTWNDPSSCPSTWNGSSYF